MCWKSHAGTRERERESLALQSLHWIKCFFPGSPNPKRISVSASFDLIRLPKKEPFFIMWWKFASCLWDRQALYYMAHSLTIHTSSSQAHTHCYIILTQKDGNNNVLGKQLSPIDVIALRYSLHMLLWRFETMVCLLSSQL